MSPRAAVFDGSECERLWLRIEPYLGTLKFAVASLDRELLQQGASVPDLRDELRSAFAQLVQLLQTELGEESEWTDQAREEVGARVQAELLPLVLLSENAERWYAKPRGYAGDYLSIAMVYDAIPRGLSRVGEALDRCFLDLSAVRAVQNRRGLIAAEIRKTLASVADRPLA